MNEAIHVILTQETFCPSSLEKTFGLTGFGVFFKIHTFYFFKLAYLAHKEDHDSKNLGEFK